MSQNVEQISWALRKSLDESFRQFGTELKEQLAQTITATRKAMEVALQRSAVHLSESAAAEIRLQKALQTLEVVRGNLTA